MRIIELVDLENMPTLAMGQADSLKIDTTASGGRLRVWISRCSLADGETQPIKVEQLISGRWVDITEGAGRSSFNTIELDGAYDGYSIVVITRCLK